jgi:hypothetical protein
MAEIFSGEINIDGNRQQAGSRGTYPTSSMTLWNWAEIQLEAGTTGVSQKAAWVVTRYESESNACLRQPQT